MADKTAFRKRMRSAIRGVWNTDEGYEIQLELERKAREIISKPYKECAYQTEKPFAQCLREKAEAANLSAEYIKIWGKSA